MWTLPIDTTHVPWYRGTVVPLHTRIDSMHGVVSHNALTAVERLDPVLSILGDTGMFCSIDIDILSIEYYRYGIDMSCFNNVVAHGQGSIPVGKSWSHHPGIDPAPAPLIQEHSVERKGAHFRTTASCLLGKSAKFYRYIPVFRESFVFHPVFCSAQAW